MFSIRVLSPFIIALCVTGDVIAQEPQTREQMDALLQSSYTQINGKETPELVPNHIRMGNFFDQYKQGTRDYQIRLRSLLSKEDQAVLGEYANQHRQMVKEGDDDYTRRYMEFASHAKDMSAMEIATAINKLTADYEARKNTRYQSVLNRLSEQGKKLVNDFAFDNVRPMFSIEDETVVANAAPEFYKLQIVGIYELAIAGKIPPPPKAKPSSPAVIDSESGTRLGSTPLP